MAGTAMTLPVSTEAPLEAAPTAQDALAYQAPFLIEKLLKEKIADTSEEAEALFTEVKRFMVLTQTDHTVVWDMYSLHIDEAWHNFVLFTWEYMGFCKRFFGRYIHHSPSNAPKTETVTVRQPISFEEFGKRYEQCFGSPPPELWRDETSVTLHRRIFDDHVGRLTLRHEGEDVELVNAAGDVLLRINELAHEALDYVSRTPVFYVRELPASLTDEEKVELVATLVEYRMLRIGG
jgi:hypothetical protein